jgi:broad specificity phosphatase PhoE
MRIILARHGKPHLYGSRSFVPCEMKSWIETYNDADVILEGIPAKTLEAAHASGIVVASTLRRSKQSAQVLCDGETPLSELLFCEAGLPFAHWHFPKLPAPVWAVIFRLAWFLGYSTNAESFETANARARGAAERLINLAKENRSVFLVGHGIINSLITKHLLTLGWVGPAHPARGYWQFSTYHGTT